MKDTMHRNIRPLTVLQRVETDASAQQCSLAKKSCILLVTKNSRLADPVMDYAINVADRMNCKVLASYVNTLPLLDNDGMHPRLAASAIQQNGDAFKAKAAARGVEFEYVRESGKISKVISRLCRMVKRVEFVLIDQGIKIEEAAFGSPVPVFNIVCTDTRTGKMIDNRQAKKISYGEKNMKATSRKSHLLKTLIFGTMTAALYAAVFTNSEFVMTYFTRGGIYALLPVATVFVFSYAHGSFTSNFWSALGIEGSKATVQKQAEKSKTVDKRRDTRPRVQASA
ncbi:universal stress protein [Desulfopila sp. IMCC35006]|uniref:universal stress protein n=1 Tax=Desulfopila sp. IMCC35006 TaxID=2569542 RepID=UPI0010ACA5A6|nr:universal stress protein [Desulfopila sp. IMCC35006]TKB28593.1 universal stress protein [Desulfopila sp. IMCC35006]